MSLFSELKRRKILLVAVFYVVVGWLLLRVADIAPDVFGASDWGGKMLTLLLVLGFPSVIAVVWIFERTRRKVRPDNQPDAGRSAARWVEGGVVGALLVLVLLTGYQVLLEPIELTPTGPGARPTDSAWTGTPSVPMETPSPKSIAVLPFFSMSPDREDAYFSDGIAEQILTALARVPGLRVAPRTSTVAYRDPNLHIGEIAGRLNVRLVLKGSVQRQDDRVRVAVQLVEADGGFRVWSETYDRALADIFAVQDEIAATVARALEVQLAPFDGGNRTGTRNLKAYDFFLRGMHRRNLGTHADLTGAIGHFRQAIAADPGFARARAALAMTYVMIADHGHFPGDASELSGEAAQQALALDPRSVEAMVALALSRADAEKDLDGAIALIRQALSIHPTFASGHQRLGNLLSLTGRLGAALASLDRAVALEPAAPMMGVDRAAVLYLLGRPERALAESERVLAFAPDHDRALMQAANLSLALGDRDRHREFMTRLGRLKGEPGLALIERIIEAYDIELLHGPMIDELERMSIYAAQDPAHPSPFRGPDIPVLMMRLGGAENALAYFKHLSRQRHRDLGYWLISPDLAALRCESVVRSILEDLNVTPYWGTRRCDASGS